MALAMPVVWSDRHRLHDPGGEVWVGVRIAGHRAARARRRDPRRRSRGAGARFVDAEAHDDDALLAVHDADAARVPRRRVARVGGRRADARPGQDRVVPYVFAHPGLTDAPADPGGAVGARGLLRLRHDDARSARARGRPRAAAVDVALTAADLVLAGAPAAYACCRPPGPPRHARELRRLVLPEQRGRRRRAPARARSTARWPCIDVDAHHGNGTQAIFYDDPDVLVGSVHVDPGAGWFPHFLGFAERDGRAAPTATSRWRRGPATSDGSRRCASSRSGPRGARALVVALGVDAAGGDPESPLQVTAAGFRAAGRALGALGLPTVVVQEGGYDLDTIGALVHEFLTGLEEGADG